LLVIYEIKTGNIVGINTNQNDTFESMYPDVSEEFKLKYNGLIFEDDTNIINNYTNYKILNNEIILKEVSEEINIVPTPTEQRLIDIELAIASILGGA